MNHVSAIELDAVVLGNADARIREHLADCAACRADAEAAAASREHFASHVFARTLPAVLAKRQSRWWIALSLPILAVAAILLFVATRSQQTPELGIKGTAAWQVFANRDGKTFQVHDGGKLAAGDRMRFVVVPNGAKFLLIASVDGAGNTSIYFPFDGTESGKIDGGHVELPGSIVLDTAPGPERMFALFSNEPIAAGPVKQQLKQLGADGDAIRKLQRLDVVARAQLTIVFEKASR
ncbi:MAG: hypothetical protein JWO36_2902 [Myxococcales bacterium]|nr:hypothetical protein [Myxococcales bacterium]